MSNIIFLLVLCFSIIIILSTLIKYIFVSSKQRYYIFDLYNISNIRVQNDFIYFSIKEDIEHKKEVWFKTKNILKHVNKSMLIEFLRKKHNLTASCFIYIEKKSVNSVIFVEL